MLDLSVVIPTHNRVRSLADLLESLRKQNLSFENFEIIVISNLDDPCYKTLEFKKLLASVKGLHRWVGAVNVNRARNLGIQIAKGKIIQLLDDDCLVSDPHFLVDVLDAHETYPEAIAIGGSYESLRGSDPVDKAYSCVAKQWQQLEFCGDYRSTRLVGGNVSYKKKLLHDAGEKFDESIQFGATEAEFHQRLREHHYETLFLSYLKVVHKTDLDPRRLVEKAYRQAKGHEKFKIDEGFSLKTYKTFQSTRDLEALRLAQTNQEYRDIVKYMKLYDWAFNATLHHPDWDDRKLFTKSKKWMKKNKEGISEIRP